MDNDQYDPQQDPEYQAWLDERRAQGRGSKVSIDDAYSPETNAKINQAYDKRSPPGSTPEEREAHYRSHMQEANAPSKYGQYQQPSSSRREFTPQSNDKDGKEWDKTAQQGDVFATFQRKYRGKDGKDWFNGQLRLVVKNYHGNDFVSLENWKVHKDDTKRDLPAQRHEWKGGANIQVKELRDIAEAMLALAERMDGGVTR